MGKLTKAQQARRDAEFAAAVRKYGTPEKAREGLRMEREMKSKSTQIAAHQAWLNQPTKQELAKQNREQEKAKKELLKKEMQSNLGKTWVDQYRKGNTVVKGHWRKVSKDISNRSLKDKAKLERIYKNMRGSADKEQLRLSRDITKFGQQAAVDADTFKTYVDAKTAKMVKEQYNQVSAWKDSGYGIDEKGRVFQIKDKEITNALRARDFVADYAKKAGYKVSKDSFNRPGSKKYTVSTYLELEKPERVKINGRWETRFIPYKKIRFSDHATGRDRASEELQITKNWVKSPNLTPEELYKLAKEI